jgi:hypothetical protein
MVAVVAALFASLLWSAPTVAAAQTEPTTSGFVLLGADGGIFTFNLPMAGAGTDDPARCANASCTSIAVTPSGLGYWILNTDTGAIYPFGTAGFYGDPAAFWANVAPDLVAKSLQIVPTPDGQGYWVYSVLAGMGTMLPFGDAMKYGFFGNTFSLHPWGTGTHLNGHPVAMALTPDGKGYWEVFSDGGVYAFGDAKFYGSTGGIHLAREIIGITATADGQGYWLYAADGGVFAFGDAVFGGSTGGLSLAAPIVGMIRNPSGPGYWLAAADGGIFGFGGAPWIGSLPGVGVQPHVPIAAIAAKHTSVG